MGKRTLILKGDACGSPVLAAAVKGFTIPVATMGCIFIYSLYCTVQYSSTVLQSYSIGYVRKLITLYFAMMPRILPFNPIAIFNKNF